MADLDIAKLRSETPGTDYKIHLNNAGAGLMARPIVDAVHAHLELEASIGGYEAANQMAAPLQGVYTSLARLLNAKPSEIAIMENATVAWDRAFYSIAFKTGDHILTCQSEYGANYVAYLQMAKRVGVIIKVIPNNAYGETDPDALRSMIEAIGAENIKLISITHIPTNGGLVNPAAEIGRVANAYGILYLLDACQSVGQMPIDVEAIGCDILSAAGRKFLRGPRGTGFLYMRQGLLETLEPTMIDHFAGVWVSNEHYELRGDARRFELWENNYATRMGLGVAVDYALDLGLEAIYARAKKLADYLRNGLGEIPGLTLFDLGRAPCAIVTFAVEDCEARLIAEKLLAQDVNVSVTDGYSTRLDATARDLPAMVRLSPHYYNNHEELNTVIRLIKST